MIERVHAILDSELSMLPYRFMDLEKAKALKVEIEKQWEIDSKNLFKFQRPLDNLRPKFRKEEFRALCSLYFSKFLNSHGFDVESMLEEIGQNRRIAERHLGKTWLTYIDLIARVRGEIVEKKPKGLLKKAQ